MSLGHFITTLYSLPLPFVACYSVRSSGSRLVSKFRTIKIHQGYPIHGYVLIFTSVADAIVLCSLLLKIPCQNH